MALIPSPLNRFQHTDALGSPVLVTDGSRNQVGTRTEYEPYGQILAGGVADRPNFTGHVADAQTSMDYMQQRYYDPMIGRFLSVDPVTTTSVGGNFNRYWYASDNPYRFIDPDGRDDEDAQKGRDAAEIQKKDDQRDFKTGFSGSMEDHHESAGAFLNGVSAIGSSVMKNPTTEGLQKLARSEGYVKAADHMTAEPNSYYRGETHTPAATSPKTNEMTFYKPAFEHGYFGLVSFMDHEVVHFYINLLGIGGDTRSIELKAYSYQMSRPAFSRLQQSDPMLHWGIQEKYERCKQEGDCE